MQTHYKIKKKHNLQFYRKCTNRCHSEKYLKIVCLNGCVNNDYKNERKKNLCI